MLRKTFKIAVCLFLLGLLIVAATNIRIKHTTKKSIVSHYKDLPHVKTAIIFGAGINGNQPGKYLKDRLDAGITLFKAGKVDKLLLSGDNGNEAHDELTVMKLYCYEHGVDSTKIYLDYAGFDTYSTMYRAKHIFKTDSAILVSQAYHLKRAVFLGNNSGIKSFGFAADEGNYAGYRYVRFRELLAITKSYFDILIHRKPHFLGEEVNINGPSNYTKK